MKILFGNLGRSERGKAMLPENDVTERLRWLKMIDRLSFVSAVIGGAATLGLMVHVIINVGGRIFFGTELQGTLDVTQYVWMPSLVSLGLGYALLRGEHLRVSLLTAPSGPQTQRVVEIVSMASTFAVTGLLIWFGVEKASEAMSRGETAITTSWLIIWPFRWVVVIGLAVLLLQALAMLMRASTYKSLRPVYEEDAALGAGAVDLEDSLRESKTTMKADTP